MTVQEIHKEVYEDIKNLKSKLDECKKDFKRIVLKQPKNPLSNRNYPFSKSYDTKTSEKKNFFISTFTALKRSDWEKPIVSIFGIYSRSEGNYAVSINIDIKTITIYPPHFFKRYRERIIKDDLITNRLHSQQISRTYNKEINLEIDYVINKHKILNEKN